MTRGPLQSFLGEDHVRLDRLFAAATPRPGAIDQDAYDKFCAALFRHITMEERVLFPEAARLRGGVPLPVERRLRADHAALAALLVPTPTPEIALRVKGVLAEHNPLEDEPGGLYDACAELFGAGLPAVMARLAAIPMMRAPRHLDGPRFDEHIEKLMRARAET